jgi:predicted DNA-binding ribbon-helix-helix protein
MSTYELAAATLVRIVVPALTVERGLHITKGDCMKGLAKHRVPAAGHRIGVRLGSAMWEALGDIAHQTGSSVSALVTEIDRERKQQKLDVAIRNYVVAYYRAIMQAALHGDVRQRCAIIPKDESEQIIAEPSSGTPKVLSTHWRAQPLHGVYSCARQLAPLLRDVLPVTPLGATDR